MTMDRTNPFRESSPTNIPDRVAKLESDVKAIQSGWRENVWTGTGWRRLGALVSTLTIITAAGLSGWHIGTRTVFRGSAWGVAARHNSEREALRWGRDMWPTLQPANVYCTPEGPRGLIACDCYVTDPNHTTWRVVCDDDDPISNDGCRVSSVVKVIMLPTERITPIPTPR